MARKAKNSSAPPVVDAVLQSAEAGHGAPQALIPEEARGDIVVHPVQMTRVDLIDATDWNTNVQSAVEFNELIQDVRDNGFGGAVEVTPYDAGGGNIRYLVLSGEWRWKAAKVLGIPEIPASHLTHAKFSERQFQMALSIRRNNIHGRHDKEKLRAAVAELAVGCSDPEALRRLLAFTRADEWKRLVGETRKGLEKQGATPEMMQQYDEKAANAKSLADLSVIVSRLFELYKDTVPYGFMVFTYGKKEHLMIAATRGTMKAIHRIVAVVKDRKLDANSILGPALSDLADRLEKTTAGPAPAAALPESPDDERDFGDAPF